MRTHCLAPDMLVLVGEGRSKDVDRELVVEAMLPEMDSQILAVDHYMEQDEQDNSLAVGAASLHYSAVDSGHS